MSAVAVVGLTGLWAAPPATAVEPPQIDVGATPPDGPPGPDQPMRQGAFCPKVGTLPGTDYRVQPHYMDMLDLGEAWRFGRGAGQKVAVIDTGVSPHPRLTDLVGGGDYVVAGGDGLADCDAHGTIVASLIAAQPADGKTPLPPPPPDGAGWHPRATPQVVMPAGHAKLAPESPGTGPDDPAPPGPPAPPPPPPGAPAPPPPPAPAADGFSGVAPDVQVIAIRQSSKAFSPKDAFAGNQDPATRRKAGDIRTMARAIVHAANMGATVINISEVSCMTATDMIDQRDLGAAIHYAAVDRNVVIVAAAGNVGNETGVGNDCKQNPIYNPLTPNDPRDWAGVTTVATPAWFSDYVLTVGAVDSSGAPLGSSMAGPWVSIAAPGTDVEGLSPRDDGLMNAVEGNKNTLVAQAGTSFSAALVSGVAALVRAKYPQLTAHQVINRLLATARAPARGVDNQVGHGIVDPVAALTYDLPPGEPVGPQHLAAPLVLAPPKVGRDMTPVWVAAAGVGGLALLCSVVLGSAALMRRREGR
nr:type VII secretion-associated serine protease mycosin [Mycobacterium nebraskense]